VAFSVFRGVAVNFTHTHILVHIEAKRKAAKGQMVKQLVVGGSVSRSLDRSSG